MINKIQNYYRTTIRSNENNLKGMQFGTKAALFYVASNKNHNLHYPHCPLGPDSWCKYNQDHAKRIPTYEPRPELPMSVET